jgi:hypothetical protein
MSSINAKVPPLRLSAVDTPADGEIPSYQSSSGDFEWVADASGTPAGSDTEIQFNDSDSFGASALLTWANNIFNLGSSGVSTAGIKSIGGKDMEFSATQTDGSTTAASVVAFGGDTTQDIGLFPLGAAGKVQIGASSSDPGILSTRGTDQNLGLKVSGTGAVEVENTTSNNDTTFQVAGNGTGKPIINLKNDAMSASLEVTTNQELTIKGGTESFVFDVSSATGGIQWPDGTSQITASSGGGSITANTMNIGALSTFTSEVRYEVSCMAPWSGEMGSGVGYNSVFWADQLFGYPFIAKVSGQLSELGVKFGSTTGGIEVAIYDSDDTTGLPTTLLGYGSMTASNYAEVYDTSLAAPTSGTVGSLVQGSQYWACYIRLVAGTATLIANGTDVNNRGASCQVTGPGDTDGGLFTTADYSAGSTFPDTLDMSNAYSSSYYIPKVTFKV